MSADELSCLSSLSQRGWLSTDHVTWTLNEINKVQMDTLLLCPNAVVNIKNEMARRTKRFPFWSLKLMVFVANVGKKVDGSTFFGRMGQAGGNHWVLIVVELRPYKHIFYCDTLAWQSPPDLLKMVNEFVAHIPQVGKYHPHHLTLAHPPETSTWKMHYCDGRCLNYPIQTCTSVCGVIAVVIAAVAALEPDFFRVFTSAWVKTKIYLHKPTEYAHYLRRVLIAWFVEQRIELNYILTPESQEWQTTYEDHTFASNVSKQKTCPKRMHLSTSSTSTSICTKKMRTGKVCPLIIIPKIKN